MSFWVAGAVVVGSVAGAVISSKGASDAADAQSASADASVNEQRRQYDQTRTDYAPWRAAGEGALNRLNSASTGDMSSFYKDPSYDWTRSEGQRGIEQTNAARGTSRSGNALKALSEFNQNLASTQYGSWWNRQAGLAGVGQNATDATAQAGQNSTNNISNALMQQGDARASGIVGSSNAWGNALNGLSQYAGSYYQNKRSGY